MTTSTLAFSTLDSERFGLRIFRCQTDVVEADRLAMAILDARADIVILRVPAGQGYRLHELERYGLPVIQADTLVYYHCVLGEQAPRPRRNAAISIESADAADAGALRDVVAAAFQGYSNHYSSNVLLPESSMVAGYQQWAEGHIDAENSSIWLARDGASPVGFLACRHNPSASETEITLNGVIPEASGAGIYTELLRHCMQASARLGMRFLRVSTQVGNYRVQKAWAREGLHLYQAFDTYHVNALLSAGDVCLQRTIGDTCETDPVPALSAALDRQLGGAPRRMSFAQLTHGQDPVQLTVRTISDRDGKPRLTALARDSQQRIVAIGRACPASN